MNVCMYVCVLYECVHVCMYVCMYVCVHVCMYVCVHVCMYICVHVCMYICMCACMYVCVHVCMYVCMYEYPAIYILRCLQKGDLAIYYDLTEGEDMQRRGIVEVDQMTGRWACTNSRIACNVTFF